MDIYTNELDPYSLVIIYRNGQTYHLTGQSKKIVSTCGQVKIKENKGCIVFLSNSTKIPLQEAFL